MRDPKHPLFELWQELMVSGDMTGPNRPVGRVTLGKNYVTELLGTRANGSTSVSRTILDFGPRHEELENVKSIEIQRSLGQEAATCSIVVYNDSMPSYNYQPEGIDTGIGRPGYMTPQRGQRPVYRGRSVYARYTDDPTRFPTQWGYPPPQKIPGTPEGDPIVHGQDTKYVIDRLIPNRMLRTYQGYGSDNFDLDGNDYEMAPPGDPDYVHPRNDTKLVMTGIWLIDRVRYSTDGLITIECRDLAKLGLEQVAYPPLLPVSRLPLVYGPNIGTGALGTGTITDWSQAVKELVAWAGFARYRTSPGVVADPMLGVHSSGAKLQVWGEFEHLGAGPIVASPPEFFLSKSFAECATIVADFLGANLFVDELGRAIFRMPNIYTGGNFISSMDGSAGTYAAYGHWPIEFHENANLLDWQVTIDDAQVRSEILVVGESNSIYASGMVAGGHVLGINPETGARAAVDMSDVLARQVRLFMVPGDRTSGFTTVEECQRMAELIALRILHSYRKGQAKILAHPALQLDDQVRIYERITNEYNAHYVSGISSRWDRESGEYTMDVTTHWLGNDPDADWFVDYAQLTPAVSDLAAIVQRLGDQADQAALYGPGGAGGDPGTEAGP